MSLPTLSTILQCLLQGRESRAWERQGGGISDCRMKKRIRARKEVQAGEKERCTRGGIGYEAGAFVVHSLGAPPGPREEEVKRHGVKG